MKQYFYKDRWIEKWLSQLHLPNIKSLTSQNVHCSKNCLELIPFREIFSNIIELRLLNVELNEHMYDFRKFLDCLTKLEVFVHAGGILEFTEVTEELHQRFPYLRGFGYTLCPRDHERYMD